MAAENGKPGVSRWRRLSAAAGIAALIGVGSVLAAAPASAATAVSPNVCGSYHSWSMCVTYEGGGEYDLLVGNGYGVSELETLWIQVNSTRYSTQPIWVAPGTTEYTFHNLPAPGSVYAGIDGVTIA